MSSFRAGVGSATTRSSSSSSSRLASMATAARAAAPLRALSSPRRQTSTSTSMPTPVLRRRQSCVGVVVTAASSSGSDDGTQAEGFSPSDPQTTSEERRRSAGSGAVAIPWYYLTPARTFLAASSLKLISFTMTSTLFATALLPFGFWQSACAAAGGIGLALLAKKLEAERFAERATALQWFALVVSAALAAGLFARVVPGRTNISFSGALDVSPRSSRTIVAGAPPSTSSASPWNPSPSSSSSSSSLPPAPVRSPPPPPPPASEAPRPRLMSRADADRVLTEMMRSSGKQGPRR